MPGPIWGEVLECSQVVNTTHHSEGVGGEELEERERLLVLVPVKGPDQG